MKSTGIFGLIFGLTLCMSATASAATLSPEASMSSSVVTATSASAEKSSSLARHTLGFNFVGLSQGKTNIYLDIGGLSENVTPALSFRSYSNKEARQKLKNEKLTVDRSLATLGVSVAVLKRNNKSVLLNPYLFFGNEKDAVNASTNNGIGARILAQVALSKGVSLQGGFDANNMEENFRGDAYLGLAFAL